MRYGHQVDIGVNGFGLCLSYTSEINRFLILWFNVKMNHFEDTKVLSMAIKSEGFFLLSFFFLIYKGKMVNVMLEI